MPGFILQPDILFAVSEHSEASMNFDLAQVDEFLTRVSGLITSGFDSAQRGQVLENIARMEIDEEITLQFEVVFGGAEARLRITVVLDDYDAPILYFFTIPALASAISALMAAFSIEHEG